MAGPAHAANLQTLAVAPQERRVEVLPTWVQQQLADALPMLRSDTSTVKAQLSLLGIRFTVTPVYNVKTGERPYLRCVGEGEVCDSH
jgi:hypothetical protein